MGLYIFDQYSYLHYASGIMFYFWGVNFWISLIIHTLFEYLENTNYGMHFINNYFTFWPGGKPGPDSIINRVGDTIAFIIGWYSSYYIDFYGAAYGLYKKHL